MTYVFKLTQMDRSRAEKIKMLTDAIESTARKFHVDDSVTIETSDGEMVLELHNTCGRCWALASLLFGLFTEEGITYEKDQNGGDDLFV